MVNCTICAMNFVVVCKYGSTDIDMTIPMNPRDSNLEPGGTVWMLIGAVILCLDIRIALQWVCWLRLEHCWCVLHGRSAEVSPGFVASVLSSWGFRLSSVRHSCCRNVWLIQHLNRTLNHTRWCGYRHKILQAICSRVFKFRMWGIKLRNIYFYLLLNVSVNYLNGVKPKERVVKCSCMKFSCVKFKWEKVKCRQV